MRDASLLPNTDTDTQVSALEQDKSSPFIEIHQHPTPGSKAAQIR